MTPRICFVLGLLLFGSALSAQNKIDKDRYPEVRILIHEAEQAGLKLPESDERKRLLSWIASVYARAGYLENAARLQPVGASKWDPLLKARVLYGGADAATEILKRTTDPETRCNTLITLADLSWRMGDSRQGHLYLEEAGRAAIDIADAQLRERLIKQVEQNVGYVSGDPPIIISATPHPSVRINRPNPRLPPFPITPGGFRNVQPDVTSARAGADAEFLTTLYGRIALHDVAGLIDVVAGAETPMQRTLGIASMEHLALQRDDPSDAERFASYMPVVNSDCVLAKAEALSAAGAAWLRAQDCNRAQHAFHEAADLVVSVPDLPIGKINVFDEIASAEFRGGLIPASSSDFDRALRIIPELPPQPQFKKGQVRRVPFGVHYRNEGYQVTLIAAIRAHDLAMTRHIAKLWKEPGSGDGFVLRAWLESDQKEEGIAYVRRIPGAAKRVTAEIMFTQELLQAAGAPQI